MSLGVRIRPANSKRVAHICLFCRPIQEKISAGVDRTLYAILEQQIIPIYYKINQDGLPEEWLTKMRQTISLVEQNFTI